MEKHSPVSEKYLETGASVQTLAMAAIQYSDNGASNLLMERYVGGPEGLTAFMRSTGDTEFRLDRWELELNSAIPGDKRDTSTPKAVAMSLKILHLVLYLMLKIKPYCRIGFKETRLAMRESEPQFLINGLLAIKQAPVVSMVQLMMLLFYGLIPIHLLLSLCIQRVLIKTINMMKQ